jgi:undecaprenyl diphosphate synthase
MMPCHDPATVASVRRRGTSLVRGTIALRREGDPEVSKPDESSPLNGPPPGDEPGPEAVTGDFPGTGLHVAIIMDGNGRWATSRGLPRVAGHRAGAQAVRRVVEGAARRRVRVLTLYAFSSDNWQRPPTEVSALMGLLRQYLRSETAKCVENGIRLRMIGRRDRLDPTLVMEIEGAEAATVGGTNLDLRIAVDYSARDALVRAAARLGESAAADRGALGREIAAAIGIPDVSDDVDLLIRTGGEQRLSDFLLWECAYAELLFLDTMWPDFDEDHLQEALRVFHSRQRRFGRLPQSMTG